MTTRPMVLVPPSLAKSAGGRHAAKPGQFDETLRTPRRELLGALDTYAQRATPEQLARTFSARGELLERALSSLHSILEDRAPRSPAWRRYQGVVWTYLDPATLTSAERHRLVIPSGVYGLSTGEDPIADYRLKMNVSVPGIGVVARFWRPLITAALSDWAPRAPFVSLLPKEHAVALDLETLGDRREVVHVHFVAADEQRAIGHDAKAIKGLVARAILRDGLAALESVEWTGWSVRRDERGVTVTQSAKGNGATTSVAEAD